MEDFDQEGMDDDGGDDGADDMNDALEDMEEIDEYVHHPGSPDYKCYIFSELVWSKIHIFNCIFK